MMSCKEGGGGLGLLSYKHKALGIGQNPEIMAMTF